MPTSRRVVVVGDSFSGCGHIHDVYTVSSLAKKLRATASDTPEKSNLPNIIHWGQGVGSHERNYIARLIENLRLDSRINIVQRPKSNIANRGHVHKLSPQNVLISIPEKHNIKLFVADLLIDSRNELLIDHVTGQHVQGMVLVEACRQMFLAVTEEYLLEDKAPAETYFVINTIETKFKSFVFPIDAQVIFSLENSRWKAHGPLAVDAIISIWQNDIECVSCSVKYAVYDATQLSIREQKLAEESIQGFLRKGQKDEKVNSSDLAKFHRNENDRSMENL